jgi:hypothetical protein
MIKFSKRQSNLVFSINLPRNVSKPTGITTAQQPITSC